LRRRSAAGTHNGGIMKKRNHASNNQNESIVEQSVKRALEKAENTSAEKVEEQADEAIGETVSEITEEVTETVTEEAEETVEETASEIEEAVGEVTEEAVEEDSDAVTEEASVEELVEDAEETAEDVSEEAEEEVTGLVADAIDPEDDQEETTEDTSDDTSDEDEQEDDSEDDAESDEDDEDSEEDDEEDSKKKKKKKKSKDKELDEEEQAKEKSSIYMFFDTLRFVAIGLLVGILLVVFVVQRNDVYGSSMEPTLQSGDAVFVQMITVYTGNFKRGDIVTIDAKGMDGYTHEENLIKRIIGLPGETIKIEDGNVYINGQLLDESAYLPAETRTYVRAEGIAKGYNEVTLGPDEYYCMGDNRGASNDSRLIGPFSRDKLESKVMMRIYPFNKLKFL